MTRSKLLMVPSGFGVRQPSGAFRLRATDLKAAEGCRSPRRYRAHRREHL
jgi:hypothetical protein